MDIVELFAGIGSQTQALKNIGVEHKVVAVSEIDKYAMLSYEAMHGKVNNLGDIMKIESLPKADLWTYSFPCFTADTFVLTDNGYKKIVDVVVGDKVLTHKNRYRRVTATYDQGTKAILKIQGMGIDEIKCTPNHRFYVRTRHWKYKHNPDKHFREFDNPTWKEAKNLTNDDFLGVAINQNSTVPTWDGITFHWNDGRKDRYKNELAPLMNNKNFWWFIGRYMGDGWQRHQESVILCCGKDELDEILPRIDGIFSYGVCEERTVYKIHIPQKELGLFVKQFGKGEKNKRLTDTVLDLPIDLLKEFLDGYISADGCFTNNRFKATSISRELIYGIAQCVAKVYKMPYSVYWTKRPPKCVIEGRTVNQNDSYDLAYKIEPQKQDDSFYENGYVWFPIRKIEESGVAPVYDISVEEDESFTANGVIAHNCQDISVAGHQAGIKEGTRSGLLFEVERLLRAATADGTLPKYLLLENVKNLVGKKFRADFDSWLLFLSSLGYTNYWKVLNAKDYGIPQNRERVFCVSIRGATRLDECQALTAQCAVNSQSRQELRSQAGEHTPYVFPEKQELKLRLRDMIDEVVDEKYYLKESTIRSILHSNFNSRRASIRPENGIVNTLCARDYKEPQCVQVGELTGEKWDKMHDISRRVYEPDGLAPTIHCAGGGNTEPKVVIDSFVIGGLQKHQIPRTDGISPALTEAMGKGGGQTPIIVAMQEKNENKDSEQPGNIKERFFRQAFERIADNDCLIGDTVDAFNKTVNHSGLCPTLTTRPEGFKTAILPVIADSNAPIIVSMRGRNPDNPSDRTAGSPTQQRLEGNSQGLCNTLTTVQKDNLVMENAYVARRYSEFVDKKGYLPEMFVAYNKTEIEDIAPTLTVQCSSFGGSSAVLKLETPLKVKSASERGYDEAEEGDYINTSYPNSDSKRGRVGKGVAHALCTCDKQAVVTENVRIRKLTPRECLRLMGWKDEQIDKIQAAGISGTQQYRQAGNGIVVQVLEAIFKALFLPKQE